MKKNSVYIGILLVLIVTLLGGTYAYFSVNQSSNNGDITGDAAMVGLTLSATRVLPVQRREVIPQLMGTPLEYAIKNSCIDDNDNEVCQVYKIIVRNDSTASVFLDGSISFFGDDHFTVNLADVIPNMKWMLISSFSESNVSSTVLGNDTVKAATSTDTIFITEDGFEPGESKTYYIVVWLNETGSPQGGQNSEFHGNVTFSTGGSGVTATFN